MNNYDIAFAPQLPLWLIIALIALSGIFVLLGLVQRVHGAWLRTGAWAAVALALLNPAFVSEDRQLLKNIVAVIVDKSASQKLGERQQQTEKIRAAILDKISKLNNFEIRETVVNDQISAATNASTALFKGLKSTLQDIAPEQIAGAILITDGQVHDIPKSVQSLGINAPVHAFITGKKNERDRRIKIINAPRFGIVGEIVTLSFQVKQHGIDNTGLVAVEIFVDGEEISLEEVSPGEINTFDLEVPHGGKSIIELRVEEARDEISIVNNSVYATLNGIRENLRVLLVSGEPHAGERTWRNLLKSDASVDLVHFTILRPPEKQDGTPINQLSLIAFPTRELFVEKIDEFDLIIFDRYSRRGVLPTLYFDNIARYVEDGGAILIAAGPEFAERGSIAQTPLQRVLPAYPDGNIVEKPFQPAISELGKRHPITRDLAPPNSDKPKWSRWFRSIGAQEATGDTIMTSADEAPLLVLKHVGEGRIALILSDHVWLWARGFQGGGPHVKLLRRLAHWLMREPELEEENLSATSKGANILIRRQTLAEEPQSLTITTPTDKTVELALKKSGEGIFEAEYRSTELGLHRVDNDELSALTHVGPANPREFADVISTTKLLEPLLRETGGAAIRVAGANIPRIIPVNKNSTTSGKDWIGLKKSNATLLRGINSVPLFSGLLGLALLLLTLAAMWTREGRR